MDHNEGKQQYNEWQAVEQALRKQIVDAIPVADEFWTDYGSRIE